MKSKLLNYKKLIFLLVCLFAFVGFARSSEAAETLPPGLVIGDDSGMYADSSGSYYIDLAEVQPGDSYKKEITIRSLDLKEPFELGLLVAQKEKKGPVDWNKHVVLQLILDGKIIYEGPLLGDGSFDWRKTPLKLGVCRYGKDKILQAVFKVDSKLTVNDLLETSELQYYWTFVGTKKQTTDSSTSKSTSSSTSPNKKEGFWGKLPKTGEELRGLLYKILVGILLILIVLLLWKKSREKEAGEKKGE